MKKSNTQIEKKQNEYFNYYKEHIFFKKYIGDIDLSSYEYLAFRYDSPRGAIAGLKDLQFQYALCCKLAYILNLKLIAPKGTLEPKHNYKRVEQFFLSNYYDINCLKINGKKIDLIENEDSINPKKVLTLKGLTYDGVMTISDLYSMLEDNNYPFPLPKELFPVTDKFKNLSTSFILKNKIEGGIHIRRGDRLRAGHPPEISKEEWDLGTRSKNILDFLDSKKAPKSIYVATDMTEDDLIIKELRNSGKYNFSFLYDFDNLKSMKEQNNYQVFNLEMAIINHELLKFKYERFAPIRFYKNRKK